MVNATRPAHLDPIPMPIQECANLVILLAASASTTPWLIVFPAEIPCKLSAVAPASKSVQPANSTIWDTVSRNRSVLMSMDVERVQVLASATNVFLISMASPPAPTVPQCLLLS